MEAARLPQHCQTSFEAGYRAALAAREDASAADALVEQLRPPRRALTPREEEAFNAACRAVFEQQDQYKAEGKELRGCPVARRSL
jgi:hypothetical protein